MSIEIKDIEKGPDSAGNVASQLVKVSNSFARGQWGIQGIMAPKIIVHVAMQVKENDEELHEYEVPFKVITDSPRLGLKTREDLDDLAKALLSHRVYLENKDGTHSYYNLFIKFTPDFDNQSLKISFHPDLRIGFLNLKKDFTLMSYIDFISLSTAYAQKLYRLLSSWKNTGKKTITLIDLHFTLETPVSLQDNFADFRRRVMERSMIEINEKTQLNVSWEPISRNGRKVVAIEFAFHPSQDYSPEKNRLVAIIINEFGVSEREAIKHSNNKTEEDLEAFVKYMRALLKKKANIANIASYARTTLINFIPPKKDADTPKSFYESLTEDQKSNLRNEYIAAQNIPDNLISIIMPGLNESNEDFIAFVNGKKDQATAKANAKEEKRKTNEYWNKAKVILQSKLSSEYETWIKPVDFWNESDTTFELIFEGGKRYPSKYLEAHYLDDIQDALLEVGIDKEVTFHF